MKIRRRQFLQLAAGGAALPAVSRVAWAQTYPTRPVTMVVTYPAGSALDTEASLLSSGDAQELFIVGGARLAICLRRCSSGLHGPAQRGSCKQARGI
jgi:hypothetical protein